MCPFDRPLNLKIVDCSISVGSFTLPPLQLYDSLSDNYRNLEYYHQKCAHSFNYFITTLDHLCQYLCSFSLENLDQIANTFKFMLIILILHYSRS